MRYLCDFRTRKNEVCSAKIARRDQRAFRYASRALVADGNGKNAVAFASVSGTAAVVAFRLRSSRLSACTSLFRPPNRRPKQSVIFHHEARRRKLSNIWQWPQLRNPSNNAPAVQFGKPQFDPKQCLWRPAVRPNHLVKLAVCISAAPHECGGQSRFWMAIDEFFSQVCEMRNPHT